MRETMEAPNLLRFSILFALFVMTFGGCQFPTEWSGRWFQSAVGHLIKINSTYIDTKGECVEKQGEKFITVERTERDVCFKCVVIHDKHPNVLQYKESLCNEYSSLDLLCHDIPGDAVLYSMFRAEGATPIPCPFKSPPYTLSYNRGNGDCNSPPSRVDSCTDESRLLLSYLACPDISGTESTGEELVCLAKWKDGSIQYLVGKITNTMATSDEERYRCFVYDHARADNKVVFKVAQSGDATCSGLFSPLEGSKTMILTRIETQEERCKFPSWVTNHHHWHSLDYRHSYHFSHKNATLKITREHGVTDMRLVCHNIVSNGSSVTLVAHSTEGCTSGYICLVFHRRDSNVIQLQQSEKSSDPAGVCGSSYFNYLKLSDPVTLVTSSELPSVKCAQSGRYTIKQFSTSSDLKKRSIVETTTSQSERCSDQLTFSSLTIGCSGSADTVEFQSSCPEEQTTAYYCHGSWSDNMTTYLISSPVSRKSTDAKRYCFVFKKLSPTSSDITVQRLPESCSVQSHKLSWAFNLTSLGQCIESSASSDTSYVILPSVISLVFAVLVINLLR